MTFEAEETDEWSSSIQATGTLSDEQTLKAMQQAHVGGAPSWVPQTVPKKKSEVPAPAGHGHGTEGGFCEWCVCFVSKALLQGNRGWHVPRR